MKISELLEAIAPKKSNLPSAASIDDAPVDDVEGGIDSEENVNEFAKGVDDFKKISSNFGPDLYSFSSIVYHGGWDTKNSSDLAAKLNLIDLDGIDRVASEMRSASGRDGSMTFVIVNGRSGEVVVAGFGEDSVSDGIVMATLDADQTSIVNRINALNIKYARVGGGVDEETNIGNKIRNQILVLLEYNSQPIKDIDPEADAARDEYENRPSYKAFKDKFNSPEAKAARKEKIDAMRAAKKSAGREKR